MTGRRIRVRGQVQGVGFRPFVWALARRFGVSGEVSNDAEGVLVLAAGGDLDGFEARLDGVALQLTPQEFALLRHLVLHPGRAMSREILLQRVWGQNYFGGTRTVDVHVRRLRSKIEDATHTFIDTVWNVGYRFHG